MTSRLLVDKIEGKTTANTVQMPNGSVIQTLSTTKTDDFSMSAQSYADVTGLSVTITPKFNTSKILVRYVLHICNPDAGSEAQVVRGSTAILNGTGTGTVAGDVGLSYEGGTATTETVGGEFLDSPATTSATTYKIQVRRNAAGSGGATFVNRDSAGSAKSSSTITVMEIAQ
jgi:hypothetical protein